MSWSNFRGESQKTERTFFEICSSGIVIAISSPSPIMNFPETMYQLKFYTKGVPKSEDNPGNIPERNLKINYSQVAQESQ